MRLSTLLRCAVTLSTVGLLSTTTPQSAFALQGSRPLVADATIAGDWGYVFVPITIHGKSATLFVDLQNEAGLTFSTAALKRLGVSLAGARLDSVAIGAIVEHDLAVELDSSAEWSVEAPPPGFPPVVGVAGVPFANSYDMLYDFPGHRAQLYQKLKQPVESRAAWLPPGIKPTDCGPMVHLPPGAGTLTAVQMKLDGHPVTGVLEIGPYQDKMNQAAVEAMGLTEKSPQVQLIPDTLKRCCYNRNGHDITHQVLDVHMSVGDHQFLTGPVQIFPVLDVDANEVVKPKTPVMLMSITTIRNVMVFNSISSGQVCVSKP